MKNTQDLLDKAKQACEMAYAPYSKFQVGAALITEKGNIYTGCNIENASYGLTICAERNAIAAAVNAEGASMKIKSIAIAVKNDLPASPCGACRQVISEFSIKGATEVIYRTAEKGMTSKKINELLPEGFNF